MDRLEPILEKLKTVTDKIDQYIDDDIIEMVAVLNYLGFPTDSSCQGHPERGSKFNPWIVIGYSHNNLEKRQDEEKTSKANFKLQAPLLNYLNEFYQDRPTQYMHRLTINTFGRGFIELCPLSHWAISNIKDNQEREQIHAIYKKEMDGFRDFLKTKI